MVGGKEVESFTGETQRQGETGRDIFDLINYSVVL